MPPARWTVRASALASAALVIVACASAQGSEQPAVPGTIGGIGITPQQPGDDAAFSLESSSEGAVQPANPLPTAPPPTVTITMPEAPRVSDNRVFMVGDSVMEAMATGSPDSIDLYVGALGWDVTVDAVRARFTNEGRMVVKARRDEIHEIAVVMLGNNYGGSRDEYADQVSKILSILDGVKVILWFTTPLFRDEQQEVNDVLRDAAALDQRLILLDWEQATKLWPSALRSDGIHPTQYGTDILAQMIANALGRAPGVGPETTIPRIGNDIRPDGTGVDKGERNSTPRPGQTSTTSTTEPRRRDTTTSTTRVRPVSTSAASSTTTSTPARPTTTVVAPPTTRSGATTTTRPTQTVPPTSDPKPTTPATTDPPKTDPPKTDPPKTDPPKTDPPKTDPPKTDPPKTQPPPQTSP